MRLLPLESLGSKSWILILFGSLALLQSSLGQKLKPPCPETLEDFCCNGDRGRSILELKRGPGSLGGACQYCSVKGYSWGRGCKNAKPVAIGQPFKREPMDGPVLFRGKLSGRRKKANRSSSAAAPTVSKKDRLEQSKVNNRPCTFGTEPWCVERDDCGKGDEGIPAPPEDDEELREFCRGMDWDFVACREYPGECIFDCAEKTCKSKLDFKLDACCNCSNHCFDPCACKDHGCEYSVASGTCQRDIKPANQVGPSCPILPPGGRVLPCRVDDFPDDQCARYNGLHSIGGVICRSRQSLGICEVEATIHAVNLNGPSQMDQYRITYKPESEITYEDPFGVRQEDEVHQDLVSSANRNKQLYKTFIYGGRKKSNQGMCISYEWTILQDGFYQLGLKVMEHLKIMKMDRSYNILLNNVLIVPELDILKYTETKNYGTDIYVNFQVKEEGTIVEIAGFPPMKLVEGKFRLALCPGTCKGGSKEIAFQLSAFSVVRMRRDCETVVCEDVGSNACECLRSNCQYHKGDEMCVDWDKGCRATEFLGQKGDCERAGVYYASGGTLCQKSEQKGNCTGDNTVFAVNTGGMNYTDSRGIYYFAEDDITNYVDDDGGNRVFARMGEYCNAIEGVTEADSGNLWSLVVHGNVSKDRFELGRGCAGYPLPICEDGRYELSIKTVESFWAGRNIRRFNVFLADRRILVEVDLSRLGRRCTPIEFIILFEMDQGFLRIQGHPPVHLSTNVPKLQFCYGECDFIGDQTYQVSAYSLARLGDVTKRIKGNYNDQCHRHSGNVCDCKDQDECEYNVNSGDCVPRKDDCSLCEIGPEECRRPNTWYASAGLLCKSTSQSGNCEAERTIMSLNQKTKSVQLGRSFSEDDMDCISYDIPNTHEDVDGWYEIQISLGDYEPYQEKKKTLTFRFNKVYITKDMQVVKYMSGSKDDRGSVQFNINFRFSDNGKWLHLKGHPVSEVKGVYAEFEFCLGNCKSDEPDDETDWMINSFNVTKIRKW